MEQVWTWDLLNCISEAQPPGLSETKLSVSTFKANTGWKKSIQVSSLAEANFSSRISADQTH